MKRIVLFIALVATAAVGASCKEQPNPLVESLKKEVEELKERLKEATAPRSANEYTGTIQLHNVGSACKIKSKSPDPIRVKAGSWITWTVTNGCRSSATMTVLIVGPGAGNRSDAADPLSLVVANPIGAGATGPVVWKVKTKAELNPRPGTTPDKWSYKWRVNNAVDNDPELEVEY